MAIFHTVSTCLRDRNPFLSLSLSPLTRTQISEKLVEVEVRLAVIVGKELPPVMRSTRKVETLYAELELLQKSAQALEGKRESAWRSGHPAATRCA